MRLKSRIRRVLRLGSGSTSDEKTIHLETEALGNGLQNQDHRALPNGRKSSSEVGQGRDRKCARNLANSRHFFPGFKGLGHG